MIIALQALICLAPAVGIAVALGLLWQRSAARDRIAKRERPGFVGTDMGSAMPLRFLELSATKEDDIRAAFRDDH